MNGYVGFSMSQNARDAYDFFGEKPLSKWTKAEILSAVRKQREEAAEMLKSVPAAVLKRELLEKTSWHHTSKMFNKTSFYSVDETIVSSLTPEIVKSWSTEKVEKPQPVRFRGTVFYIEWTGTRKHPRANQRTLEDVNIEERGSFYVITDDEGKELLRKKIGSNGTYVVKKEEKR